MKKAKKKVLGQARSSYHGKVRIPYLSPDASISLGKGVYMDSGCPGHVEFGAPEGSEFKELPALNQ